MDRNQIEELVELYRESLIYFIARYVGDLYTAEDLAEDVFVELLLHPDRYRGDSSMKTYLFSIGRNKAIDFIRKHSRVSVQDNETMAGYGEAEYYDLESHVVADEEKRELARAMETIKEEYRYALHLVYFEDMSYDEAGEVMGKTRKQIENLVYRGKQALRLVLANEDK